ncbi:hypothetical protein Manayef4_14300 [Frankia sp. CgMI4]|uniref:hypothetical protein n=1 Tax=Frankia sp. CgMI4 TaxID=1742262 RepID=UPI00056B108C|nr:MULTISPECIES: hypothetical protein [unclassified Frankia]OFB42703.1 hypothetical protein Manayef4_14300 [Frankia sp. CgIM4]
MRHAHLRIIREILLQPIRHLFRREVGRQPFGHRVVQPDVSFQLERLRSPPPLVGAFLRVRGAVSGIAAVARDLTADHRLVSVQPGRDHPV